MNTEATGTGTSPDAGAAGGTGGTGGTGGGTGGSNCFPTSEQKFCGASSCPSKTDPAFGCGQSSCAACSVPNAIADCASDGTCGLQSCNPGFSDCDGDAADGCEVNTGADPKNCGACGNDCFAKGATTNWVCNQGSCEVSNCPTGKGDCNNDSTDGCETDLTSDPNNCAYCTGDCSTVQHATPSCTNSKCGYTKCDAGWADCDGDPTNGCEQDIASDPNHCGACGTVCSSTNGTPGCVAGQCTITCTPGSGYGNCNGPANDGCETPLTTTSNCGGCKNVCSTKNSKPTCDSGSCTVHCNSGFADCNGTGSDGCEVDFSRVKTCGGCGNDCTSKVAHATATCDKGACSYSGACAPGWGDCSGGKADGCETPLNTTSYCGACGTNCNGVQHATAICSSGSCSYSGSCAPDWGDCNGDKSDGCEKNVAGDVNNCGSCGYKCSDYVQHAGNVGCDGSGACTYTGSCSNNWKDCDGNKANGCEVDLTQLTTCGACGNDCTKSVLHVSASQISCGAGNTCTYSGNCDQGWADCDGDKSNGCEADLHSTTTCGNCNTQCPTNKVCKDQGGWSCHNP